MTVSSQKIQSNFTANASTQIAKTRVVPRTMTLDRVVISTRRA